jgi:hypothetical protein
VARPARRLEDDTMMRRGRPGLIGTMARTAVIAGTAQATTNAVNAKAQQKAMAQQQAAQASGAEQQQMAAAPVQAPAEAPASAAPAGIDMAAQLTQLKELTDQGILTQEEFEAKKRQLLGI